jgi:inosine-uridine nucleoside N-ribohydrolase
MSNSNNQSQKNTNIQKWIIDTDPGSDDMMAILYLLSRKQNEVLLISTVDG